MRIRALTCPILVIDYLLSSDDVVDAAWNAGIAVHALIRLGQDGPWAWMVRRDRLIDALHTNPKAKFVTRSVQFGSQPLYDWDLEPKELASEVKQAQDKLADIGVRVTVSELAYGYQWLPDGAQEVLDVIDFVAAEILPFFAKTASTGACERAGGVWILMDCSIHSGQGVAERADRPAIFPRPY